MRLLQFEGHPDFVEVMKSQVFINLQILSVKISYVTAYMGSKVTLKKVKGRSPISHIFDIWYR